MGVKTQLNISALVASRAGSVELPEEVTAYCSRCETRVADKGNCLARIATVVGEVDGKKKLMMKLVVDCRVCGYDGEGPVVKW